MSTRREFLAGLAAAGSWLALDAGAALAAGPAARRRTLIQHVGRPADLETPVSELTDWATPNDLFFVRSHFDAPEVDAAAWTIAVSGDVDKPLKVSLRDLKRFPAVDVAAVLQCAGNGRGLFQPRVAGVQWEKGAVGNAVWTGARLRDVLAAAGLRAEGRHVVLSGADRPVMPQTPPFERSLPIEKALDPDTILAYAMNGKPLPLDHGFPVRAVVPGWAGDIWMKWLTGIRLQAEEGGGFFMKIGYRIPPEPIPPGTDIPADKKVPVTAMPVKSLIVQPAAGAVASGGTAAVTGARVAPNGGFVEVTGVAWSGEGQVVKVEVSVDGGATWDPAEFYGPVSRWAWRQWRYAWKPSGPGSHVVVSRATDSAGNTQPMQAVWNPSGYHWNAVDSVIVEVAG